MQLHLSQPNLATHQCFCLLQCRQKTVEDKRQCSTCTQQFCPKCLTNRYGPGQEQVRQAAENSITSTSFCLLPQLLQQLPTQLTLPGSLLSAVLPSASPVKCIEQKRCSCTAAETSLMHHCKKQVRICLFIHAPKVFLMPRVRSCTRVTLICRLPNNPNGVAQNARKIAVAATAAR